MPIAKITPLGESGLYHIHVLEGRTDPGFGQGGVDHPDHGLPGTGGHPSHPIHRPPVFPDNSLPETPPPMLLPGYTLVMVRNAHGKWEYAAIMPGSPPPRPLPPDSIEHPGNRPPGSGLPPHPGGGPMPNPPYPDQGLPPSQPGPDQGLPGGPPVHPGGGPVQPMPSPTRR